VIPSQQRDEEAAGDVPCPLDPPVGAAAEGEDKLLSLVLKPHPPPSGIHSILDVQLEQLSLEQDQVASLILGSKGSELENGSELSDFPMFKKGPNSLLGTGSSIASASDHEVSGSDFESDSGIENSHVEGPSPEVGVSLSSKPRKKGVEAYINVLPHDDLALTAGVEASKCCESQSELGEKSDIRINSFIQCLDHKVRGTVLAQYLVVAGVGWGCWLPLATCDCFKTLLHVM